MSADGAYNPWHDDAFADELINDLLRHFGEWRHPERLILERRGGTCDPLTLAAATYYAVSLWRRVGLEIEGDTHLGHRLVGAHRVRFVRVGLAQQWPPEMEIKRKHRPTRRPLPGQLKLTSTEAA